MTGTAHEPSSNDRLLKLALSVIGAIFCMLYPLGWIWPSGWVWHGGKGVYYFQMMTGLYIVLGVFLMLAARNPAEHRSLIQFTIWSSIVHAVIMAVQAIYDHHELGHLIGDVPALLIAAGVLWYLLPADPARQAT